LREQVENQTQPGRLRILGPEEASSSRRERVKVAAQSPFRSKNKVVFFRTAVAGPSRLCRFSRFFLVAGGSAVVAVVLLVVLVVLLLLFVLRL